MSSNNEDGLQILLLTYKVQSFVLLTANVDDIKKIASKFVSDSLADKIAEFVVRATEQITKNSDMGNVDSEDNISKEDDEYRLHNIARQREEKQPKREIEKGYYGKRTTKKENSKYWSKKSDVSEDTAKGRWNSVDEDEQLFENTESPEKATVSHWWDKFKNINEITGRPSRFSEQPSEINKSWLKDDHDLAKNKIHKILPSETEPRQDKSTKLRHYIINDHQNLNKNQEHHPNNDFEAYYKHSKSDLHVANYFSTKKERQSITNTESSVKHLNHEPQMLDKYASGSGETLETSSRYTNNKLREFNIEAKELLNNKDSKYEKGDNLSDSETRYGGDFITTKKEKTDFDQYENRNYPKAENYIATSGKLMSPKVSRSIDGQEKKDWWEKRLQ